MTKSGRIKRTMNFDMKKYLSQGMVWLMLILCSGLSGLSQTNPPTKWTRLVSQDEAFSIALPGLMTNFVDSRWHRTEILANSAEASFQVTILDSMDGRDVLSGATDQRYAMPGVVKSFVVGKHKLLMTTMEGKAFNLRLDIGTSHAFYSIKISATSGNNKDVKTALASILLDGKPLMRGPSSTDRLEGVESISVKKLETSSDLKSLAKGQPSRPVMVENDDNFPPIHPDAFTSRQLLILTKERPDYTDEARARGIQGQVTLRVEFKADGTIGRIAVTSGLGGGLNAEAARAAARMTFLPAQVDGRPTDTSALVSYSFSIAPWSG
jgi:TonB family protein